MPATYLADAERGGAEPPRLTFLGGRHLMVKKRGQYEAKYGHRKGMSLEW